MLRPIAETDLAAWYGYLSRPDVHEHTSWNLASVDDLRHHVWTAGDITEASAVRFAIVLRTSGELVGTAGFHSVSPQNRSAEIAYDLSPSHWQRGIATAMCTLLTDWAHREASMVRVQATALDSNTRSAAVLRRAGFEHEGLLRSFRMVRGVPGDFHMYSHVVPAAPT